jgi:DNA-binding NarL/FixJ family response regulator
MTVDLSKIKITPRDRQILDFLALGCSNDDIGKELDISEAVVKRHLSSLANRAGLETPNERRQIRQGLALAYLRLNNDIGANALPMPGETSLTPREIHVAQLIYRDYTTKKISELLGIAEQVVKNYLRNVYDALSVWTRLELALYVHHHGGENWPMHRENNRPQLPQISLDNQQALSV